VTATEPFPIMRVEVTIAAALTDPTDHIVGGNVIDATIAFGWRTSPIPEGVTDAQVCNALSAKIGPVIALIQSALTLNGWVAMGEVDEPMGALSTATGEVGHTRPVKVTVRFPDEGGMVHD
jgi:hypothetical protein